MDAMYDVVALGELLIDFTCESVGADGCLTMSARPGGAPANFLAALARYGLKTALIGKVGDDAFGQMLIRALREAGVDTGGMLVTDRAFTTLAFVTLDAHGEREFSFARKPGADTQITFEELPLALIDHTRAFHFGTLSLTDEPARTATVKAVDYARKRNKLITFDPNLREPLWEHVEHAREQMLWGLSQADVVKLSREEALFLFDRPAQSAAAHIVERYGVKLVFVTCGADGCWYRTRSVEGFEASLGNLSVVDTTGAGDIFGGAALYKLLACGKAPERLDAQELRAIAAFASAAAGLSTQRRGGIPSVPGYDEVMRALKARL